MVNQITSQAADFHPGDLVVDTFGTFLGKRSERVVVRWREVESESEPDDAGAGAAVVRFPGVGRGTAGGSKPDEEPSGERGDGTGEDAAGATSESHSEINADDSPAEAAARGLLAVWRQRGARGEATRGRGEGETRGEGAGTVPLSRWGRLDRQLRELAEEGETSATTPPGSASQASRPKGNGTGWREREVPLSRLRSVTVTGRGVTLSSDLVEALVSRGIGLAFLSGRGEPVAHLHAPGLGATVETRRAQLAAYDQPVGRGLAAAFVAGKLRNQRHTLLYFGKYLKETAPDRFERVQKKAAILSRIRKHVLTAVKGKTVEGGELREEGQTGTLFPSSAFDPPPSPRNTWRESLMGMEGTGARVYWEAVATILEGKIAFPGRETRGALDPVNAALNYGYGILYSHVFGAVVNAGLEPFAGFLHVDRPGKPSLVLDLVEEFRAPAVDRSILALVNQGSRLDTDTHGLTAATRRLVADRVLEQLEKPVPFEGKRQRLRIILQMQARHVATAVRGERTYRPFCSRW